MRVTAPVTLADIRAAADLIRGSVVATPFTHSRTLSSLTGAQVFVKFENLQFTASFKDRGALVKLSQLTPKQRKAGVIAVSAGNHAQGVAYHAQRLAIPATIVMPTITPYTKVRQTKEYGARVLLHGQNLGDTEPFAKVLVDKENLTLVHPYDDVAIIAGQGTVGLEMITAEPTLDAIIVPVGGGGLIAGCAVATKGVKPGVQVIGAETALYPSLYQKLRGLEPRSGGATIADGIAVKTVGAIPFEINRKMVDEVLLVGEPEIEQAICLYLEIEKTVAEGAGAASLAALITHPQRFAGKQVGIVLTGGNIDPRLLAQVITRGMVRSGRVLSLRITINDVPGTLARVATIVGESGSNIIEVHHQRLFTDIPVKGAELDLMVETRDPESAGDLMTRLQAAGFAVQVLSSLSAKTA